MSNSSSSFHDVVSLAVEDRCLTEKGMQWKTVTLVMKDGSEHELTAFLVKEPMSEAEIRNARITPPDGFGFERMS